MTASKALDEQLDELRRKVAASAQTGALDGMVGDIAEWLAGLNLDRQRAVIAYVIEQVTVKPSISKLASDPDVNRLVVDWRAYAGSSTPAVIERVSRCATVRSGGRLGEARRTRSPRWHR